MSTESKAFYRISCDAPGCTTRLEYDTTAWWDWESIEPICTESDWLLSVDEGRDQHFCPDHWTYCDECGDRVPTRLLRLVNGDEHWCDRCEQRVTEALEPSR